MISMLLVFSTACTAEEKREPAAWSGGDKVPKVIDLAKDNFGFEKKRIRLGKIELNIEEARTMPQKRRGLMGRTSLEDNHGMLFVYEKEKTLYFHMKNTFIPLSIGFFDKNQRLVDIQKMEPVKSLMQLDVPQYKSRVPAQYALEVTQGWFEKNNIKTGTRFTFIKTK